MAQGKRVVVFDSRNNIKKIFESQLDAAKYLGVDQFHIWCEVNNKRSSKILNKRGILVMRYEEYENLKPVRKHRIVKDNEIKTIGKKKPVRMLDIYTNEILDEFDSIAEAREDLGISYGTSITRCCRGEIKTAHGYKWEFII